ncbi:transposase [Deinococcus sp. 12RED42]|uniref:transposase n=1 Tax=Deinococcus sp. 12RED42 TaxID=2745872 RepID=UPI001E528CA3|nr:transposase [Deinococcus sp. 12RED42]
MNVLTVPLSFQPDPDIWTVRVQARAGEAEPVILHVSVNARVTCPGCGSLAEVAADAPFVVADLPHGDRPVLLRYRPGRVACRCGYRETVRVPDVRRGRSGMGWTDELARYLTRRAADTTDDLRLRTGLPNTRIRELAQQGWRDLQATPPSTLGVVGIDELYFGKQRYAVVTDIDRRRLLACVPVASTVDGLSDRIDLRDLLSALPVPTTVALDMNPAVLDLIRSVWKKVKIVIDKRHALQTADRTYRRAVLDVINKRQGRPADSFAPLYGEAAYQSYRLRDLLTMRAASCTVADLATWRLMFKENIDLLQQYLFREQLYEHFSEPSTREEFSHQLQSWSQQVEKWNEKKPRESVLGGTLLTLRIHEAGLLAYRGLT